MRKEKILPILAITVLLIGTLSTVYVHATQSSDGNNSETITINKEEYNVDEIFSKIKQETIKTDDGNKTGIPLDEVIKYTGVNCPGCHKYIIKASDSYQQTVEWKNMKNGVLSKEDMRVYFPNLAHSFWIRNVVEIEVE
ncbi:MAG: hypothetical protein V5A64_03275 [Candidatus Thermoplasmatota archaeon]